MCGFILFYFLASCKIQVRATPYIKNSSKDDFKSSEIVILVHDPLLSLGLIQKDVLETI